MNDGYIKVQYLLDFCANQLDHSISPNDIMRIPYVVWISVKDRLPEAQSLDDDNWVLVWFGEGSELKTKMPLVGRYDAIYGTWTVLGMSENTQSRLTISHWMPLPKPPKEG